MEHLNDEELRGLLRQWQAPNAPTSLEAKVLDTAPGKRWWKWLLTGSIRIPVPVGILAALVIAWILFQDRKLSSEVNFTSFQPVKELKPRIVKSTYENN